MRHNHDAFAGLGMNPRPPADQDASAGNVRAGSPQLLSARSAS